MRSVLIFWGFCSGLAPIHVIFVTLCVQIFYILDIFYVYILKKSLPAIIIFAVFSVKSGQNCVDLVSAALLEVWRSASQFLDDVRSVTTNSSVRDDPPLPVRVDYT